MQHRWWWGRRLHAVAALCRGRGVSGALWLLWIATHNLAESAGWEAWVGKRLDCLIPLHFSPSPLCKVSLAIAMWNTPTCPSLACQSCWHTTSAPTPTLENTEQGEPRKPIDTGRNGAGNTLSPEGGGLVPRSRIWSKAFSLLLDAFSPFRPHFFLVLSSRLPAMLLADDFGGI